MPDSVTYRLRVKTRITVAILSAAVVMLFNNCAVGFKTNSPVTNSSSSTSTPSTPTPTPPSPSPVVLGSRAVLVGYGGRIMQTYDSGETYPQDTLEENNGGDDSYLLRDVMYANGVFVAVGWRIMTSTDGVTWSTTPSTFPSPAAKQWLGGIAYGNSTWVLVGGCGTRYYSIDNGKNWNEVANDFISFNGCGHLRHVAFGNGLFYAVGDSALSAYSPDGINWTVVTPTSSSLAFNDIVFAYGKFYAITTSTDSANLYESTNGQTWTLVNGVTDNIAAITFSNDRLVASGKSYIFATRDGSNWNQVTPMNRNVVGPILSLSGGYISFGWCQTIFSKDLVTWTMTTNEEISSSCNDALSAGAAAP